MKLTYAYLLFSEDAYGRSLVNAYRTKSGALKALAAYGTTDAEPCHYRRIAQRIDGHGSVYYVEKRVLCD